MLSETAQKEEFKMARNYDLMVVGGGVVGLSTAYFAALEGASVGVVERNVPGQDCASASAGWLVPSYCHPLTTPHNLVRGLKSMVNRESAVRMRPRMNPHFLSWICRFVRRSLQATWITESEEILVQLHRESMALHRELARRAQGAYEFYQGGILHLYLKERSWKKGCQDGAAVKKYDIPTKALNSNAIHDLEPNLGAEVVGAVHYPGDAWLAPQAFMLWLIDELHTLGVEIHHKCEVYDLEAQGSHVTAVRTTRGTMGADQVVLATGAWMPGLSQQLGRRMPIEGAKGYSATFRPQDSVTRLPLGLEDHGAVVAPYKDRVRIIFGLEIGSQDLYVEARRLANIPGLAGSYLPVTQWGPMVEIRRGLRPVCADGMPVMGRLHKSGNVFVAGGHDQKGLSLGPVTGYRLARLLAGEAADDIDRWVSPERFTKY